MNYRFEMKCAAVVLCAVVAVACESGMNSPASPSAVVGSVSALNADGSTLKVNAPLAITPLFEATNISITPTLAARGSSGNYVRNQASPSRTVSRSATPNVSPTSSRPARASPTHRT